MPIIKDAAERKQRAEQKRHALLRFLRDELYTTPEVAGLVMACGERAARATIAAMEKQGLVKRFDVKLMPQLPPVVIVGITSHGQGMAFDVDAGESPVWRTFQPGRFDVKTLQHTTDIQRLRIAAMSTGCVQKWIPAERLAKLVKGIKKPDAILLTTAGQRIALEVERTQKNRQRYEQFMSGHLQAMHQNKWQKVIVASPTADFSKRLAATIRSVKRVMVAGVDTMIDPAKHHQNIAFCDYQSFTNHLE